MTPTMAAAGLGSVDADTRGFYLSEDTQQRSIASLTLLLDAGGDINAKDSRGLTALHEAARWGWNDVVTFLVSRGADLNAKDARGNTPVDSALGKAGGNSRGGARIDVHEDTAALLKKLMAEAAPAVREGLQGLVADLAVSLYVINPADARTAEEFGKIRSSCAEVRSKVPASAALSTARVSSVGFRSRPS